MRTHTTSITVDAPPHDAFAFLSDAERLPTWATASPRPSNEPATTGGS